MLKKGGTLRKLQPGIESRIILPYFLLTVVIASLGTFALTNLVTGSLRERLHNQLLDAGRVVSESMVDDEEKRLQALRAVIGTVGVGAALAENNTAALAALVPQIIANSDADAVELINVDSMEVYGWQRRIGDSPTDTIGVERQGASFASFEDVRLVLAGFVDAHGDKRVLLSETPDGLIIFTVGPVQHEGRIVGAAMVGNYVRSMVVNLTLNAVARVTLYDRDGRVIATTLGSNYETVPITQESPEQYRQILNALAEAPDRYAVTAGHAGEQVALQTIEVMNQPYVLAFGDWRLRGQSFGFFSVALPSHFIVNAATNSRNLFSLIFSLATMGVFTVGFVIARRISRPLNQLVETAVTIAEGGAASHVNIQGEDEIGRLAHAFNLMMARLSQHHRQLTEQASKLEAILNSIADGVVVLDNNDQIITSNAAARQLLADMSSDFAHGPLRELTTVNDGRERTSSPPSTGERWSTADASLRPRRYQIGNRVLSALAAPVQTPGNEPVGTVIVLRDVTREVEAEHLKDAFITSISHELRTPLTVIKVYADLLLRTGDDLDERQLQFMQKITTGSEQLERQINQLISISEIQAGTLNLKQERIDFPALIQVVADNWRERIEGKGQVLVINIIGEPLWVRADPGHLGWAAENLLSNAYNYTPSEGCIRIDVFRENGEARLDVVDTGIGIASADMAGLFNRFFRASNRVNYETRGVGLGLFIARAIVELHRGRIWARSELGRGSTFSLALPLED